MTAKQSTISQINEDNNQKSIEVFCIVYEQQHAHFFFGTLSVFKAGHCNQTLFYRFEQWQSFLVIDFFSSLHPNRIYSRAIGYRSIMFFMHSFYLLSFRDCVKFNGIYGSNKMNKTNSLPQVYKYEYAKIFQQN